MKVENKNLLFSVALGLVGATLPMVLTPLALVQGILSKRNKIPLGAESFIGFVVPLFLISYLFGSMRDAGPFGDSLTFAIFNMLSGLFFYVPALLIAYTLTKSQDAH